MSVEAMTQAWASGAAGNELLVLLALANYAGGEDDAFDYAYPSVGTLERMTKLSRRTVQRSLRSLEEAGHIKVTGEHVWSPQKVTIQYRVEGRHSDAPRGVTGDTAGASGVAPNPSIEPIQENPTPYPSPPGEGESKTAREKKKEKAREWKACVALAAELYPQHPEGPHAVRGALAQGATGRREVKSWVSKWRPDIAARTSVQEGQVSTPPVVVEGRMLNQSATERLDP